ncbi:endonuclease/exonuclease/phosphatase family protein [Acuticoccus kandeliae]|uniref:endonuclease/exonuclease/phosphatase family protein n=1 Tax=Acuticoccus kandeliae TaxID=2073160 RepID=UPI001300BC5F|nr:endonuclease/exonuclease/phosphatase family protein [Acuticoccus kandeliae]
MSSGLRTAFGVLLSLAAIAVTIPLAAGFLGNVHPFFDSLAHFRAHLAAVALVTGLLAIAVAVRGWRIGGAVAILFALAAGWTVYPYVVGTGGAHASQGGATYTLLQMNVYYRANLDEAVARIREIDPDFVTLEEVTGEGVARFAALDATYPHQRVCKYDGGYPGQMILSRHPFVDGAGACIRKLGFLSAPVELDGTPVTLVAQHLGWPWPKGQWSMLEELEGTLGDLDLPVVVGGDFNATPWSASVQRYAALSGTAPVTGIGATWMHGRLIDVVPRWAGLPIDNVLVSPGVDIVSRAVAAATPSDHLPVVVGFRINDSLGLARRLTEDALGCRSGATC